MNAFSLPPKPLFTLELAVTKTDIPAGDKPKVEAIDTATKTAGELIPQAHGGALLAGGKPGNKGGPGRPRSLIRERLSGVLDEHGVNTLTEILTAPRETVVTCSECGSETKVRPPSSDADRIRATDVAGKYGVGTLREISTDEVRERLGQTLDLIDQTLQPEDATRLRNLLREVWI